jgi:NTE family protein
MPNDSISSVSTSHVVDKADRFEWSGGNLEPGIALTLSGGGYRAMLFHAGALMRFNEVGLLSKTARISSVSGGSITSGVLAHRWSSLGAPDENGVYANFKNHVVDPLFAFSKQNIDLIDALWGRLPFHSPANEVAGSYDKFLFGGATLQCLPDEPRFVFCASNLQTGVLWRFSKPYAGDYLVGRINKPTFRLAEAVAASSAFPPVLSPLELNPAVDAFEDWPRQPGEPPPPDMSAYRRRVLLADGGAYDNHGLEPVVKRYMTIFVSDGGAPFVRLEDMNTGEISQLRRVFDLTDNQVRALRRRDLIARFVDGRKKFENGALKIDGKDANGRFGTYWGIDGGATAGSPPNALPYDVALTEHLAGLSTRLADLGDRESRQLVNWGYAICDRNIRTHYVGPLPGPDTAPNWPFREAPLG